MLGIFRCPAQPGASLEVGFPLMVLRSFSNFFTSLRVSQGSLGSLLVFWGSYIGCLGVSLVPLGFLGAALGSLKFLRVTESYLQCLGFLRVIGFLRVVFPQSSFVGILRGSQCSLGFRYGKKGSLEFHRVPQAS